MKVAVLGSGAGALDPQPHQRALMSGPRDQARPTRSGPLDRQAPAAPERPLERRPRTGPNLFRLTCNPRVHALRCAAWQMIALC